jgi:uncharacterized protein (TIGR00661 family)
MNKTARVLVAPLDWGLGHATRCIPVIRELISLGCEVHIAASGGGRKILMDEFPHLIFQNLPGIEVRYPEKGSMALSMFLQFPSMIKSIRNENKATLSLVKKEKYSHIISDNRYGVFAQNIKCALIAHQLNIQTGSGLQFLSPFINYFNRGLINKFNELWIPDHPPPQNLSGALSNPVKINIPHRYGGILSRFTGPAQATSKTYDSITLLSGPEPQRTILEMKLFNILKLKNGKHLLIQGKPDSPYLNQSSNLEVKSLISSGELQQLLHPDTLIIARPGYSTLMDMSVLGHKKMLLIPTPGQTEQEYLAKILSQKFGVSTFSQTDDVPEFDEIKESSFPTIATGTTLLEKCIREFISG